MVKSTQIKRLLKILSLFNYGRGYTTTQLVNALGEDIHIRTIQRDLKTLEDAGIKFRKRILDGNEKEWRIDKSFRPNISFAIGVNEYLSALIMKDALSVFKGTKIELATDKLARELDALLPDDLFDTIETFKVNTVFENIDKGMYDYSDSSELIENLVLAILRRKRCIVKYQSPQAAKSNSYPIEPKKIVQYNGALYVDVYQRDHNNFISLALHRIQALKVLEESVSKNPKYDSSRVRRGKFGLFSVEKIESIELKFSQGIAYHIENRHWNDSQEISYDEEGNLILRMEIGVTPELVSWILGWGKHCKIIQPPNLSQKLDQYY